MALRLSIGAGRGRLIQQLLVESALVAGAACVLGLLFASVAAPAVVGMLASPDDPLQLDLRLDWRLAAFAAVLTLLTTAVFGVAPALRASSVAPMTALKAGGGAVRRPRRRDAAVRGDSGRLRPGRPVRRQPAGAVVRQALERQSRLRHVGRAVAVASKPSSASTRSQQRAALLAGARSAARACPASSRSRPPSPTCSGAPGPTLRAVPGTAHDTIETTMAPVTPGFFETMSIPLRAGRTFGPQDMDPAHATAIVVNETFAAPLFRPRAGSRPDRRGAVRRQRRPGGPRGHRASPPTRGTTCASRRRPPSTSRCGCGPAARFTCASPAIRSRSRRGCATRSTPRIRCSASRRSRSQAAVVDRTLLRERLLALLSGLLRGGRPGAGGRRAVRRAELLGRAADARDRHSRRARRASARRRPDGAGRRRRRRRSSGSPSG